jgi:hypothetical protein
MPRAPWRSGGGSGVVRQAGTHTPHAIVITIVIIGNQIVHRNGHDRIRNYAIWLGITGGTAAARGIDNPFSTHLERIATMKDLNPTELTMVVGGTTKNDQITQQLTELQSSIKDVATNSSGSGNNSTFMMMAMAMAMRPQPTVVAAGAPAAAPGPVVNISTRVRRW